MRQHIFHYSDGPRREQHNVGEDVVRAIPLPEATRKSTVIWEGKAAIPKNIKVRHYLPPKNSTCFYPTGKIVRIDRQINSKFTLKKIEPNPMSIKRDLLNWYTYILQTHNGISYSYKNNIFLFICSYGKCLLIFKWKNLIAVMCVHKKAMHNYFHRLNI